jgi:D-sedoheptulose 7-phosphate isomerase
MSFNFSKNFLLESKYICENLNYSHIENVAKIINGIQKKRGRIFFLGVGGSAGNCSHAVNDFRKLANIECYTPTDNSSELTARINDEGWDTSFSNWLMVSNLNSKDCLFFFSVGGGNLKKKVSVNLIEAAKLGKKKKSKIVSIVGKADGYLAKNSNQSIIIPQINNKNVTPQSEAFQAVIWHLLVSHPQIKKNSTKW